MNYFNQTNGEAFTLNGDDYVGTFHINNGEAYSMSTTSEFSEKLTTKDTFASELFYNQWYFNTTIDNISAVSPINFNANDILNRQSLEYYYDKINKNNLLIYKNLIIPNRTVYNYKDTTCKMYAIDSFDTDFTKLSTKQRHNINIVRGKSGWNFLNYIISGIVLVDTEDNFKYICTTGKKDYILKGNFLTNDGLEIIYEKSNTNDKNPELSDYTFSISYDSVEEKFILVKTKTIEFYSSKNFDDCQKFILIDKINRPEASSIVSSPVIWKSWKELFGLSETTWGTRNYITVDSSKGAEYVKFGKNLRTYIKDNILYLYNKYSKNIHREIPLSNIQNILAVDIRDTDDFIVILHKDVSFYVTTIDTNSSDIVVKTTRIRDLKESKKYSISFSTCDSDTFIISNVEEYQTRSLQNPTSPTGKLQNCDLGYNTMPHIWNKVDDFFSTYSRLWNYKGVDEKINKYTNIHHTSLTKNGKMYTILVNYGRFYALSQSTDNRYDQGIDISVDRTLKSIPCSDSSIGLFVNTVFPSVIGDTSNLTNKCKNTFKFTQNLPINKKFNYNRITPEHILLHTNETINTISLQRIFDSVTDIQKTLNPEIENYVFPTIPPPSITEPVEDETNYLENYIKLYTEYYNNVSKYPVDIVFTENGVSVNYPTDSEFYKYWTENKEKIKSQIDEQYNHTLLVSRGTDKLSLLPQNIISDILELAYETNPDGSVKSYYVDNQQDVLFTDDMLITNDYWNNIHWWNPKLDEFPPFYLRHVAGNSVQERYINLVTASGGLIGSYPLLYKGQTPSSSGSRTVDVSFELYISLDPLPPPPPGYSNTECELKAKMNILGNSNVWIVKKLPIATGAYSSYSSNITFNNFDYLLNGESEIAGSITRKMIYLSNPITNIIYNDRIGEFYPPTSVTLGASVDNGYGNDIYYTFKNAVKSSATMNGNSKYGYSFNNDEFVTVDGKGVGRYNYIGKLCRRTGTFDANTPGLYERSKVKIPGRGGSNEIYNYNNNIFGNSDGGGLEKDTISLLKTYIETSIKNYPEKTNLIYNAKLESLITLV